jgi:hypothetical protein
MSRNAATPGNLSCPATQNACSPKKWKRPVCPRFKAMMNHTHRFSLFCYVVFFLSATSVFAQNQLIIQERISVSNKLAGNVDVQLTQAPATGVKVELYSSDWQTVLASTSTDGNGHFSFEKPPKQDLFHLQISSPGMNSYRLRVRIKTHDTHKLLIHLSVAT